jgi:hypothetical protein
VISKVITISGSFVSITAGLAQYISIAVFSGFLELIKIWGKLLHFYLLT